MSDDIIKDSYKNYLAQSLADMKANLKESPECLKNIPLPGLMCTCEKE